ncbi:MAG TPA: MarR family winged helix-turn-helix transcriptional regulator [Bacillota bacterium]|nr:MarR family winged helix-turn-helix transcriptional regulator [Bacillota bacterium]
MTKEYINRIISILYRYNQRFFAQKLEEYSLPVEVGQLPTLIQIYKYPGITQDGISSNVGIDKGTVARTVKQLEYAGMIVRRVDEKDRRINHIFVTPKGMKYRINIFKIIEELHEVLYQGFCGSKIEEAISMLDRMRSNIDNVFKL